MIPPVGVFKKLLSNSPFSWNLKAWLKFTIFVKKKRHHLEELIEGIVKKLNEILIDKTLIVKNAILSLMFWAAENVTNLRL